jgi:S-formylglutathione hydrolase
MSALETLSRNRCFDGEVQFCRHRSEATGTDMTFSVFVPAEAANGPVPVLYWFSGLTCTAENFTIKAGAQAHAAKHGLMIVAPDTSPRGAGVAGEDESFDLGTGAGFYVNATNAPWSTHYRMYDYVVDELPAVVQSSFNIDASRASVSGHSMGGHGALICALKNPGRYRSVSAFAPIATPSESALGIKAFTAYLGDDRSTWAEYDTLALLANASERLPLLVDQGTGDEFLPELKPDRLEAACHKHGHPLNLRRREGYDHSYYFVSTFMGEHIEYHAKALAG